MPAIALTGARGTAALFARKLLTLRPCSVMDTQARRRRQAQLDRKYINSKQLRASRIAALNKLTSAPSSEQPVGADGAVQPAQPHLHRVNTRHLPRRDPMAHHCFRETHLGSGVCARPSLVECRMALRLLM